MFAMSFCEALFVQPLFGKLFVHGLPSQVCLFYTHAFDPLNKLHLSSITCLQWIPFTGTFQFIILQAFGDITFECSLNILKQVVTFKGAARWLSG